MSSSQSIRNKVFKLRSKINKDPIVKDLMKDLKKRFDEIESSHFTQTELDSVEFDNVISEQRYYSEDNYGVRVTDEGKIDAFILFIFTYNLK
jgi:hypothetical protein